VRLIPLSHSIPPGIEHERFRLRPITVNDVVRDYDAVMTSAERLRERFPHWGGWPTASRTPEPGYRIAGKSRTSRSVFAPVSSITRRSIPSPTPPVGGIPCSSACR
jgi:hypothetical protein